MARSTREQIDELGNEMLRNPNMKSIDIQANTLGILSSMYDESRRRHDELQISINELKASMKTITWIGTIIGSSVILYIMGNVLNIPVVKAMF